MGGRSSPALSKLIGLTELSKREKKEEDQGEGKEREKIARDRDEVSGLIA